MDLIYKNERRLFAIAVVISSLLWLLLIVGTMGIGLIYILLGVLFYLFAQAAFITHVKGTGVRISETQYADLHERLVRCSQKIGLDAEPEAYILRTDVFNALATRFLGRNYVVLFSDVLDALDSQPGALDFYIGHEFGHIHRKHLLWHAFLLPAMFLPLLGSAYRRAEEYTCDRYGAACCETADDIRAAIGAIAAGNTRWKSLNQQAYVYQAAATNGFWMSFNELTNDYPWLTKRMATAIALKGGAPVTHPSRHFGAWLLALFVPRFGPSGAASMLVTVAMIGVLAAIAIPAYQDYTQRAIMGQAHAAGAGVSTEVATYRTQNGEWPASMTDLGYPEETKGDAAGQFSIAIYENGVVGVSVGPDAAGQPRYLVLEPHVNEETGEIDWVCSGSNILVKYLPVACQ